jgi:aspartate/methionine/tyrosine aminotransferase
VRHNLCASDVEPVGLAELLALADDECQALWQGLRLGYTETQGHPLLRAEIAAMYEGEVAADDVLVFSGAEEAIFCGLQALLGPGTHAVVTTPAYQSLVEVARASGAAVSTCRCSRRRAGGCRSTGCARRCGSRRGRWF